MLKMKLTPITVPDLTQLIERVHDCIGAEDGDTYAEVDAKFLTKLQALTLPKRVEDDTFGVWLKATDHERPSRMSPIASNEIGLLIRAFERIVAN